MTLDDFYCAWVFRCHLLDYPQLLIRVDYYYWKVRLKYSLDLQMSNVCLAWQNPYWGNLGQTHDKVREFYASTKLFEAIPVPGSRAGVQALHDMGFKLIIVTARGSEEKENSWKWVDKWFHGTLHFLVLEIRRWLSSLFSGLFENMICTGQFKDASKDGFGVVTKLSKAQASHSIQVFL